MMDKTEENTILDQIFHIVMLVVVMVENVQHVDKMLE